MINVNYNTINLTFLVPPTEHLTFLLYPVVTTATETMKEVYISWEWSTETSAGIYSLPYRTMWSRCTSTSTRCLAYMEHTPCSCSALRGYFLEAYWADCWHIHSTFSTGKCHEHGHMISGRILMHRMEAPELPDYPLPCRHMMATLTVSLFVGGT